MSRREEGQPGRIEDHLAVGALALLVVITFSNVVIRYATDQSIAWTEEISSFLMFASALLATSAAVARDRHIRIEMFFESGPLARRRRLALVSAAVVAAFFLFLGLLGGRLAWDEFRFEETSPGIGIPKWWYSIWLPILCFAVAIRALGLSQRMRSGAHPIGPVDKDAR
ncbi:MAG: TRAP transporter small permease [Burkholderiales bacterium]